MTASSTDRAARFLEDTHERLSVFARESYELDGRGVIRVIVPDVPSGTKPAVVSTEMVYHTLSEIRRVMADQRGSSRDDADVLCG
jgi:hypothetical protein